MSKMNRARYTLEFIRKAGKPVSAEQMEISRLRAKLATLYSVDPP